jgi:hypothetical protein
MNIALTVGERSHFHHVRYGKNGHVAKTCMIPWEKIKGHEEQKEEKSKSLEPVHLLLLTAL